MFSVTCAEHGCTVTFHHDKISHRFFGQRYDICRSHKVCHDQSMWAELSVKNYRSPLTWVFIPSLLRSIAPSLSHTRQLRSKTALLKFPDIAPIRSGSGGPTGASAPVSLDPLWPPDRESALITQWQISCNDFVLKGATEIKCLSSLLPNQNCWNCKHCFVWMRDLFFFPGCNKTAGPDLPPY